MPRNPNTEIRNKILDFIKRKYMINGQQPFSCSLTEIATDIGESRGEKIMHYINALERGGFIRVQRGQGNQPNTYEFVDDNVIQEINETKEKLNQNLEDFVDRMNGVLRDIINFESDRIKEVQEMIGELHYLRSELKTLKLTSYKINGDLIFEAPKNSSLPTIIENLLKDKQTNSEQPEMTDNNSNN